MISTKPITYSDSNIYQVLFHPMLSFQNGYSGTTPDTSLP